MYQRSMENLECDKKFGKEESAKSELWFRNRRKSLMVGEGFVEDEVIPSHSL